MSNISKPVTWNFWLLLGALGGIALLLITMTSKYSFERPAKIERQPFVVTYKSPNCGCCSKWVKHLQDNGFVVEVHDVPDMSTVREKLNIPSSLQSCHTAVVDGYVVEGHVPASDIRRLLAEKPAAKGLAVGGMPLGSPGMEAGSASDPYSVILLNRDNSQQIFSTH